MMQQKLQYHFISFLTVKSVFNCCTTVLWAFLVNNTLDYYLNITLDLIAAKLSRLLITISQSELHLYSVIIIL